MGVGVDPFELQVDEGQASELFLNVARLKGFTAARATISDLASRFTDKDGNFIEQFQTSGFSPRLWELYLFAVLEEAGFELDWTRPAPDFVATKDGVGLCIEAATANPGPNDGPAPGYERNAEGVVTDSSLRAVTDYLAIKFGSPLFSKLNKRYWEAEHVKGKPLVLAVSDFTGGASMISSGHVLPV